MPRKTRIVTTTTEENREALDLQTPNPPVDTPLLDRDEQELADFFAELGGSNSRIKIYKLNRAGEQGYCGTADPAVVNEDFILSTWGGGKYYLRVFTSEGYRGQKTLIINGEDTRFPTPQKPGNSTGNGNGNGAEAGGSYFASQIEILRDQINRQHELLLKGAGGAAVSVNDIVSAVSTIQGMGKPADPMAHIGVVMDALKSGIQIAQRSTNPAASPWVDIFDRAMPLIAKVMEGIGRQAAPPGNPNPAPAPIDPVEQMRAGLDWLKPKALRGSDPSLYVDLVLDNLQEDAAYIALAQAIDLPDAEKVKIDPDLGKEPFRSWFEKLFAGLREELKARLGDDATQSEPQS